MKSKKGKVTVRVKRTYLVTFHGRSIDAYWNGFTSFRQAKKYFNDYMSKGLGGYGILQRDIRDKRKSRKALSDHSSEAQE